MRAFVGCLKRLGRVLFGGIVGGGLVTVAGDFGDDPTRMAAAIVITALVNALGKWLRGQFDIRVPF